MGDVSNEGNARAASALLHRRDFLRASAALGAVSAAAVASPTFAQTAATPTATASTGDVVIRGGHVLTMDPALGDLTVGDVHVRDGSIVAVSERLELAGAEVIDASDMIVLPGFVDTHSHLWNAFLRGSIRGDDPIRGYFPTTNRAAPLCTPEDAYNSARFGLLEALLSGTTSINNFSHNTRSVEHAESEIAAAQSIGLRTRFSYGSPGRGERLHRDGVEAIKAKWEGTDPLLALGVNLQLPAPDILKSGGEDEQFIEEVRFARENGLPVSLHYGNTAHGLVALMEKHDLLGPDILMIHAQGFTAQERETMVARNVQFSMAPAIEIPYSTVRNGYIQFAELEQLGATISLSVDASSAMATADFFTVMRALQWSHKQRSDVDRTLEPKRIIEIATMGGATALGLSQEIGSLTPGKQADIILVRKTDINIAPVIDPYYSLIYSGQPGNIDTVMVRGSVLVRGGVHQLVDVNEIVEAATDSATRVHGELEAIIAKGEESKEQMNRKG